MEHSIKTYKQRDQKERELNALQMQLDLCDEEKIRRKKVFDKKLTQYQEWKKNEKINGINF